MPNYRPYPNYQPSGIDWLGNIPTHWKAISLRHLAKIKNGSDFKHIEVEEGGYPVLGSGGEFARVSAFMFDKPSVLLGRKGTIDNPLYIEEPFWTVDTLFYTEIQENTYPKFFYYFCKTIPFSFFQYGSTVPSMTQNDLYSVRVSFPSLMEQQQIAAFLDRETAKIDQLIAKQQQLIELLKEKRQAVISHTVTKGLNPDVKMQPSGVEWLGDVPEHWVVRRLKHTSDLQSGIAKGKDLTGKPRISVPMLRVANVQDGYIDLGDVHNIEIEPDQLARYTLRFGDVLMNEGGDNDKLGRGAVWNSEITPCIHQNHVFAIRPYSIEPEWLDLLTRANYAKFHFFRAAKQSTNLASISSTSIKETPLIIPPKDEREETMRHIAKKSELFERAEKKAQRQIELLRERRSALISAAVTGKIDVRDWQANKEAA
jgi:type I restriction enzyme S subunit